MLEQTGRIFLTAFLTFAINISSFSTSGNCCCWNEYLLQLRQSHKKEIGVFSWNGHDRCEHLQWFFSTDGKAEIFLMQIFSGLGINYFFFYFLYYQWCESPQWMSVQSEIKTRKHPYYQLHLYPQHTSPTTQSATTPQSVSTFTLPFPHLYNSLTPNSTAQSAINIIKNPYSKVNIILVTECYMEIQIALQKYFRSLYKE